MPTRPAQNRSGMSILLRLLDHRQHAAVGRVDPFFALQPLAILRIAVGEFRAGQHLPIFFHAIDDADFVTVLKIFADAGKIDSRLDAVPQSNLRAGRCRTASATAAY